MPDYEKEKRLAAEAAVRYVADGMTLGLGSGSTATYVIQFLGERIQREGLKLRGVPSSSQTRDLARQVGIPLVGFEDVTRLDLTIDGADEVDPAYRLLKGGGGALLYERIVAFASDRVVIACDSRKEVDALGAFPLPVEVVKFAWPLVAARISAMGAQPALRKRISGEPFVTDEGHYILDCRFGKMANPDTTAEALRRLPGVVDHGLFIGYPDVVIFGRGDGVDVRTVPPGPRKR